MCTGGTIGAEHLPVEKMRAAAVDPRPQPRMTPVSIPAQTGAAGGTPTTPLPGPNPPPNGFKNWNYLPPTNAGSADIDIMFAPNGRVLSPNLGITLEDLLRDRTVVRQPVVETLRILLA